jgi:DNA-binding MarR family transcriptional regulator
MAKASVTAARDVNRETAREGAREPARVSEVRRIRGPALPAVRPGYYHGESYRPEGSVGFLMRQAVEIISRALDARMEEYGLTDAQWRPLVKLSWSSSATATQLARWAGCDTGATTRMLDRLEDKGLIKRVRSIDDRRVQQIELTDDGRKAAAVVPYVIADVLNAHLSDLSHAEIEQLRDLLERVVAAGRRHATDATESGKKP